MPTRVQPFAVNQRDSARVEKRGPSMTTRVPPSTAPSRRPGAARSRPGRPPGSRGRRRGRARRRRRRNRSGRGRRCGRRAGRGRPGCRARRRRQGADGARCQNLAYTEGAQGPQVGAIGDCRGGTGGRGRAGGRKATRGRPVPNGEGRSAARTGWRASISRRLRGGSRSLSRR